LGSIFVLGLTQVHLAFVAYQVPGTWYPLHELQKAVVHTGRLEAAVLLLATVVCTRPRTANAPGASRGLLLALLCSTCNAERLNVMFLELNLLNFLLRHTTKQLELCTFGPHLRNMLKISRLSASRKNKKLGVRN